MSQGLVSWDVQIFYLTTLFLCIFSWVITFNLYFLGAEIVIATPWRLIDFLEVGKMNLQRTRKTGCWTCVSSPRSGRSSIRSGQTEKSSCGELSGQEKFSSWPMASSTTPTSLSTLVPVSSQPITIFSRWAIFPTLLKLMTTIWWHEESFNSSWNYPPCALTY